jgi:hypothetical protein
MGTDSRNKLEEQRIAPLFSGRRKQFLNARNKYRE